MAKELPYFKFEPNAWENGNIQMLSREDKGLFIDICSMFWSRLGDLPEKLVIQKLCGGNASALISLYEENIIELIDGAVYVKFLSIQLQEFENTSTKNSENAKERWRKHREQKDSSERNATALNSQCETDARREEKRREEKMKGDNKKPRTVFTPPTLSDVISYFKEKGYTETAAKKAFEYYDISGWKDGKGNQVKNWKQKMLSVWFKDEHKDNSPKEIPGETPEERTRRLYVERMRTNPMKMTY